MNPQIAAPISIAAIAGAVLAAGCQSTQSKSEEIAANLGPVKIEKGLEIKQTSKDVKVLDTTVLTDPNGTAVVVTVKNESSDDLVGVPIAIDVVDAKDKSVYKNNIPGLDPTLTTIPIIKAGETLDWVNSQVAPTGEPDDVEAKIGADAEPLDEEIPDFTIGDPELKNDPVSGVNATGSATNNTDVQQQDLLLYGVARSGGKIVAAGRALLDKVNAGATRYYHIFFIGDPEGAETGVTSFPTLKSSQEGKGAGNG